MGTWLKPHRCYNFAAERRHGRSIRMDKLERWRNYLAHCRAYYKQHLHGDIHDAILSDDDRPNRWHSKSPERVESQWSSCFDQCQTG
jgi:hypothetical protein